VLPGVEPLLARLHTRPGVVLGLLTGNIRQGANHKLSHFGLWDYFACGGFGDDHFERDDVARTAVAEVRAHLARLEASRASHARLDFDAGDVWVIGDTPLDVQCARAVGARVVAVATGWHPAEELASHKPDYLFADLSNPADLLRVWTSA
jgi:phosphoglycolate phosphatase-like HAD superfamily hydrolase